MKGGGGFEKGNISMESKWINRQVLENICQELKTEWYLMSPEKWDIK